MLVHKNTSTLNKSHQLNPHQRTWGNLEYFLHGLSCVAHPSQRFHLGDPPLEPLVAKLEIAQRWLRVMWAGGRLDPSMAGCVWWCPARSIYRRWCGACDGVEQGWSSSVFFLGGDAKALQVGCADGRARSAGRSMSRVQSLSLADCSGGSHETGEAFRATTGVSKPLRDKVPTY